MIASSLKEQLNARDAAAWMRLARCGDFESAWRISDRIRARSDHVGDPTQPRHQQQIWDGTPLNGRRVLIRCYHGLGDTIQFIRYAPLVQALGSEVIVWAQPALLPLLRSASGINRLLPLHDGTPGVDYDVDVEVMELPYVFRTTLASVPATVPYLSTDVAPIASRGVRVGLAWRAGDWDTRRSIAFPQLAPLLEYPGVCCYSLQLDARPDERHGQLTPLEVQGVVRTGRAMRGLDVVVTIDSMTAHLAGALGVAVWTLLPHEADWRWLEERRDSPWYPTMRLFRQPVAGDWNSVIDEVRESLRSLRA